MKLQPVDAKNTASVSINNKCYKVDQNGVVDLPNDLDKATLRHLAEQGWRCKDDSAVRVMKDAGVEVGLDGMLK